MFESSRARMTPRTVTRMAAVLVMRGMVIGFDLDYADTRD